MVRSKADGDRAIGPHLAAIETVIREGVRDFKRLYQKTAAVLSPRARASIIRDHIVARAQRAFQLQRDVRVMEKGGLLLVVVGSEFRMRFKKFTKRFRSNNVQTQQALNFANQNLPLAEWGEDLTNVEAGYVFDPIRMEAERVAIRCPNGRGNAWVMELSPPKAEPIPLPVQPVNPSSPLKVKEFARKRRKNEEGGGGGKQ